MKLNNNYIPDLSSIRNYPTLLQPVQGVGNWFDDAAMSIWGGSGTTSEVQAAQTALANKRNRTDLATRFNITPTDGTSITDEFVSGAKEGWAAEKALPGKVVGWVGDSVGDVGKGIFSNIPWWIYAGALVYVAVQTYPYWRGFVKLKK